MFVFNIIQIIYDAVEDILRKYLPMMKSLAYSIIQDYHLAEDAAQEAMLRLSQNTDKIDNIDSNQSKNYIYTVTKNEALKILEAENLKKENEEDVHFYDDYGLNNVGGQLDIDAFCDKYGFGLEIAEAIKQLNEADRDMIIYKYGAGYSLKEIAEAMGIGKEAVYKRHQRALDRLKMILEAEDEK